MQRVSTNLTLLLKLFLPTFWAVFFGSFVVALWLTPFSHFLGLPALTFRLLLTGAYLLGLALIWRTLWQLKRVEMDAEYVYATDYFKHFRYPWTNVERLEEKDFLLFRTVTIHLKVPGRFGKRLVFIPSMHRLQDFLNEHPRVVRKLL